MLKLLTYLKPYWKVASLAPALITIEVATDLLQPLLMARIIDLGIAGGDLSYIIKTGLLMIAIALIGFVLGVGATFASSIASQNFGADLRSGVYQKVQTFSFSNLDKFKTSSLITRLTNDVSQVQNIVLMYLRMMVRAPLICVGAIIMAIAINARLALILVVVIPALGLTTFVVIKKGMPLFSLLQVKLDRLNAIIRENLAGVRVVKAFARSDMENKRFNTANTELMDVTVKASRLVALTLPFIMLVMNLSIVAIIWFGGLQVNTGSMLLGEVAAFINYMFQILFSLTMVAFMLVMLSRSKVSADRINEVLQTEVDIKDEPDADNRPVAKGQVVFKNVSFQYQEAKGEPVLKDISFTAEAGQTVAVLGGTGSGKSTLVSLIPRLYDVTAGQILVDGRDVRSLKLDVLRQEVSVALQEAVLFSGTIRENILWGKEDASDVEIEKAANMAQAHDFIMSFPEGYDAHIEQKGVNLSGGQKQRLTIARALLKEPAILILDDSTSAVDVGTESRILAALKQMKKSTIFVVAQRISAIVDADKIIVLEDGRIVAEGNHHQLLTMSLAYRDIFQSQYGEEAVSNG
jgi:ATP-binding cassette subfamily B protein